MKKLIFTIVTVLGLSTNMFGVNLNEAHNVQRIETPQSIQCIATGGKPIWVKDTQQSTKYLRVETFQTCQYQKNEMSSGWSNTWGMVNGIGMIIGIFLIVTGIFGEKTGGARAKQIFIGFLIVSVLNAKFVWLNFIGGLFA